MNKNIEVYKQLEKQLRNNLEAQYTGHLFNEEIPEAYSIVGKLMRYKLISKFDDRLSPKNKTFTNAGILKDHRFSVDLRKDTNFIPDWLYADLPTDINTVLVSKEHIGERRDFGYLVDITLPKREMEVKIKLMSTPISAKNEVEAFGKLYEQETGKKLNIKTIAEEAYHGCTRIYNIRIEATVLEKYRNIGQVLVYKSLKDNRFKVKLLVKSKALQYYFIDIRKAIASLKSALMRNLNLGEAVDIGVMADYRLAIAKQKKIVDDNNKKLYNMKELQANDIRTWEQVEEFEKRKKEQRV